MSVSTYSELQSAIASWAHRADLTSIIPDFIRFAENRLYDELLLKNSETEAALTASIGSNAITLPSNYISPIKVWVVVDSERYELHPALPQEFDGDDDNTQPQYWAIDGANLVFDVTCDQAYTVYFRYIAKANLSDSATTNYLLTRRPDLYLAACMVECGRYVRDPLMRDEWEAKYRQAKTELKAAENRARAIVPLRTEIAQQGRTNIFQGE